MGNDYFNLVFTYVIFNLRDVAISPKYNFEKLLRKWSISDFCWLKTYRVWCIVLLMANPLKRMCPLQERCMTAKFIQVNKVKLSHLKWVIFLYTLHKLTFCYHTGKNKVWLCWVWQRSSNCRIHYSNTQRDNCWATLIL